MIIVEIETRDLLYCGISPGAVSETETKHGQENFGSIYTIRVYRSMVPLLGCDGTHLVSFY
jgi:hypothetical protein